ncbi:extensin family protein [Aquabacter sp. CN5-332]|uniref:extensin family protein n=1 Tax=Aquabacter sp. CN5-332 TaxID=3156608 RepID=UPI0032B478F9
MRLRSPAPFASPEPEAPANLSSPRRRLSATALMVLGLSFAFEAAATPLPTPRPGTPVAQPPARTQARSDRLPTANVPFPPSRPMDLGEEEDETEEEHPMQANTAPQPAGAPSQARAPSSLPPVSAEAANVPLGELPALCAALVEQKAILAERAPPVTTKPGCSLPVPVRLTGVRLADGNVAALNPAAILRCEAAAAIATWMRDDIGPAVAALGTRLDTIKVADSYDCRPQNRIRGGKMSEHGMGNAFDTYGFVLADKRVIEVKNGSMPLDFQNAMKASACTRFSTVLGPGSDGYHEDHIHVDMAVRRLDIKLCKWTIKTPAPAAVARVEPRAGAKATVPDEAPTSGPAAEEAEKQMEAEAHADADPVPLPPRRPASLPSRSAPPRG